MNQKETKGKKGKTKRFQRNKVPPRFLKQVTNTNPGAAKYKPKLDFVKKRYPIEIPKFNY